eukprot:853134-Prymnesium_polylepis.1
MYLSLTLCGPRELRGGFSTGRAGALRRVGVAARRARTPALIADRAASGARRVLQRDAVSGFSPYFAVRRTAPRGGPVFLLQHVGGCCGNQRSNPRTER